MFQSRQAASSPASTGRRLLVVIGASGGTGAAVVEAALAKDFRVRAVVRSTARLRDALGELMHHQHLEVVVADLAEASLIFDAVVGASAVLCTAGANPETAPGPVAAAMPNIVAACRKAGVLRLVVQACALAAVPGEWWGLLTPGRLTRAVVRWQLSSNTVDDGERVMRHARQYHRHSHKSVVISRYSKKADHFDQAALRRHAAPVASWIAYGPKGRVPEVKELNLLKQLTDKMDDSRLPSRLRDVLLDMQGFLQSLPRRPANDAWNEAERQLQKSLRALRRRCDKSLADLVVAGTDDDIADAERTPKAELDEVVHTFGNGRTAHSASVGASAKSDQHMTLFRQMNEWGFLSDAQKLERLKQAEQAVKCPRRSLSQAELTEIVILAAACLAAPRRDGRPAENFSDAETAAAAESDDPNPDLQGRVRSLFLHVLHVWRMNQFDCHAIEHVLDFVQQKISKFEDKVGEIAGAAAGMAWLKIKQVVDQLMLSTEAPSVTQVQGSQLATEIHGEASHQLKPHRVRVRLERQSGIQNITWSVVGGSWKCQCFTRNGTKWKNTCRSFPIAKFLEQGLGDEAAVEAALQEAKAYREELVHQGKLKPPKPIAATLRSTVRGVFFDRSQQKWHVRLYHPVTRKQVYGGCFRAKEKAEAKARELASQLGVQPDIEVLPVRKLSDLRCFEKLGPEKGVTWDVKAQCWHAQCYIRGKKLGIFTRPQDFSNQAVKQAWDEAVSWRRQQIVQKPR
ncbi:unnamed protein product, partial [Symbiodinium sp. CCMP2456]